MYYQVNRSQQILNTFKIISIHLLHIFIAISLFKYFEIPARFIFLYIFVFYTFFITFGLFLQNGFNLFFSKMILKDVSQEKILLQVETAAHQLGLKAPQVFVLDIESFLFLTLGFSKKSGYFFVVGKNLLKNNQLNLAYILVNQLYLVSALETALINNLIIVFAWPIICLDFVISKLKRYHLVFFKFFIEIISIPFYFYSYLFFYLLISRNRIFMADFFASKLLRSVQGFSETLEIFRVAPKLNSEYVPKILTPLLFAKIPGTYFSFAPRIEERIQYIKSIIG